MRIKLVDHRNHGEKDIIVGTCELCMFTHLAEEQEFIFRTDTGREVTIDSPQIDWGWIHDVPKIDNLARFAQWISEQRFDDYQDMDFEWLCELVDDYACESFLEIDEP